MNHAAPRQSSDTAVKRRGPARIEGKFFAVGTDVLPFRGVCYGTFRPRHDGARFPNETQVRSDVLAMSAAGFTVVRTYTEPSPDLLDECGAWHLRVLAGVFFPDWRYLLGASRRDARRVAREARTEVRAAARRFAGDDRVLALSLGNEIPADVVRWYGADALGAVIEELVDVVREEDPSRLVTYANYPTAEYLPLAERRLPDLQRLPRP